MNYCIVDKTSPSLRGEALGADANGLAVALVGTIRLNWYLVSSAYCPNVTYLLFGRRRALFCFVVGVGHQRKAKGNPTPAG